MTKKTEWYGRSPMESLLKETQKVYKAHKKALIDKGSKWKPEIGEDYYCLDLFDLSAFEILEWYGSISDEYLFKLGNCFRTKRQAQAALRRVKKALRNE